MKNENVQEMPMEDWLRGCVYHDGRSGYVTLPCDRILEIANYIQMTRTGLTEGFIGLRGDDTDEADTVEVVRCKNCKHAYKRKPINKTAVLCELFVAGMKDNDFCSHGERSEEENEAIDMAIEALSNNITGKPNEAIKRQNDVIELVRCKDCRHAYYADNRVPQERTWVCERFTNEEINANDFCSRGERSEE